MREILVFAQRNFKEMIRDRLNMIFGLGFPLVLLCLLSLIQKNLPVEMFLIEQLAPGVAVFGLSFVALFSGMLIARDRAGALMLRLYTTPMRAGQFLLGYLLPLIPICLLQSIICLCAAFIWGLKPSLNLLLVLPVLFPAAMLFLSIGLLAGASMTEKQVGGFCGTLVTNLSAWLSGIWFDPALVGGVFGGIAEALPFLHAVRAAQAAAAGNYAAILPHLWIVAAYALALFLCAVLVFRRKMHADRV